jgi:uncharacterized membrane-anchored protein YhcB (DUF1043 family)
MKSWLFVILGLAIGLGISGLFLLDEWKLQKEVARLKQQLEATKADLEKAKVELSTVMETGCNSFTRSFRMRLTACSWRMPTFR